MLRITGVTGGSSPNRLEITEFVANEKFFSLYIQALQAMSATDQANVQSFFSIGGIHGLPNQPWDGATGDPPFDPSSGQWGGYCTHGSVLFPTWHRPYVMLYEQILHQRAVEIAATYTVDKEEWKQAANDLRQPFWDWASNAIPPDEVIALPQVTITRNDGTRVAVDNPLFHYTFHPIDPSFPAPYSGWQTTIRQPTSTDPDATDDVNNLKNVLASAQSGITSNTYNMLTRVQSWPAFSNHTVGDGGSNSNSLEAIHDGIHVDVGGQGQMADPSVAAFDPIFFLHHTNVDRLLSLWAALNPGVWVSSGVAEDGGSFTTPPGNPVDQTTALTPFWSGETTFWPSATVQDTSKLGYTYPDFNGVEVGNTDATRTAIGNKVNQLYGSSVFGSFAAVSPVSVSSHAATAKKVPATSTPKQHANTASVTSDADSTDGSFIISSFPAVPSSIPAPVSNHADTAKKVPATSANSNPAILRQHVISAPVRSHADSAKEVTASSPSHNPAPPQQHASSAQVIGHSGGHLSFHLHRPSHPNVDERSSALPDHGFWEWTARVEVKKYELGTSFSVLFFLGQVPQNPREWRISSNFVGGHHGFVNSAARSCANCRNQQDLVVEGFVHLNQAITKHSGLRSLEPNVVEPYLTNNLEWRVQKSNGEVAELESLEVTVIATPLTFPPGAMFPVPGQATRHNGITHGRPGGSRHP